MQRLYDLILVDHLARYRQMAFLTGPRQIGKTTTCRKVGTHYYSWDSPDHARLLLAGPQAVARDVGLDRLGEPRPIVVFDELHKYPRWKNFLKGYFDLYGSMCQVIVTGSSRLDVFRRGGDSLMGRYFLFRMHPLSVAELIRQDHPGDAIIRPPRELDEEAWQRLCRFGGFPEPFLQANEPFSRRWQTLRHTQLFREDARDLTRVQEIAHLEIMGRLLDDRSASQLVLANLARDVGIAQTTAKTWLELLCALHAGFTVRPWFRNVSSAIRKEPKWFIRDWATISDPGRRFETMVAVHLLKAVEGWTDLGLGEFSLHYVRNKQKQEVDFLVTRDQQPWFLVETKVNDNNLHPDLAAFQRQLGAAHAFQVVQHLPYLDADCFERTTPTVVPARTFLSQLL